MAANTPKAMLWTGRIISAIPVLFMAGIGTFMFLRMPDKVVEGMQKYGYPANVGKPILIAEIVCAIIYAIPQTAVLGAILLTGYLGGAIATHVHASEPFWFPVIFAVLVWLGLFLRDARIRAIVPF
jgi:xanthine/uracil permease